MTPCPGSFLPQSTFLLVLRVGLLLAAYYALLVRGLLAAAQGSVVATVLDVILRLLGEGALLVAALKPVSVCLHVALLSSCAL